MQEQRRIDLLFAATGKVVALARFARRSTPVLATLTVCAVAVHGTLGGVDVASVPRLAMDTPPGFVAATRPQPAPRARTVVPAPMPEPAAPAVVVAAGAEGSADAEVAAVTVEEPARPRPQLDREQQNIARFIAARYRVTLDATSEFVYHAYRAARDVKLDPMLVLAVMSVESSFNPKAQSHAGAQGLMQVLTRVHVEKFLPFGGIPAAFDPVANIRVGSAILKEYLQREGSVEGALKSYVGAALAEHDGGYGMKVLNARARIEAAAAGRPIPPDAPVRAWRPASEPTMQPVSTIVETRTPLPPEEAPRSAASAAVEPVGVEAYVRAAGATNLRIAGDI